MIYIGYIYEHFNSLGGRSYFQLDCCSLIFVHNGKGVTFVFCEQMTLLFLTPCWIHLCARGSRSTGHYVMCTSLATKCIRLVRNWTLRRPICLSLHHVFPLPSCWFGFCEIRYQGFTKHCLRVVSFMDISPLQYSICLALSVLRQIFILNFFKRVCHNWNIPCNPLSHTGYLKQ